MVTITFFEHSEGFFSGFLVRGHAGAKEYGKDVVCAAISSAVLMVINTLTEVANVVPLKLSAKSGNVCFKIDRKDFFRCRDFLLGFKFHILEIAKKYPKFVCVNFIKE